MPHPKQPSYEELAARNAELAAVAAEQAALIEALRAEVPALRRQAGRDSSGEGEEEGGPAGAAGPGGWAERAIRVRAWRGRPGRMRPGSWSPARAVSAGLTWPALRAGWFLPCRSSISRPRRWR
jgi:hypothetical protein